MTELDQAEKTKLVVDDCPQQHEPCSGKLDEIVEVIESTELVDQSRREESLPSLGDRYEVRGLIGEGGMGSVYKVFDSFLGVEVAVKVLRPELASNEVVVNRFQQEAHTVADLTHANIAAVYGSGLTNNGSPYLVMELFNGLTLADALKQEQSFDEARTVDVAFQISEALAHAHMKGVVHRDLKPSNIIITKAPGGADLVHLLDFGIAKVHYGDVRATQSLTNCGDVIGSPPYMSPEQCLGLAVDVRSDIYSLGCLLYEMLTGKPAFAGDNAIQIITEHLNESAGEKLHKELKRIKIGRNLHPVILRCLARDSANRYQSIDDVIQDLALVRQGKSPQPYLNKTDKVVVSKQLLIAGIFWLIFFSFGFKSILTTSGVPPGQIEEIVRVLSNLFFAGVTGFFIAKDLRNGDILKQKPHCRVGFAIRCLLVIGLASSFFSSLSMLIFHMTDNPSALPSWLSGPSASVSLLSVIGAVLLTPIWFCLRFLPRKACVVALAVMSVAGVCERQIFAELPLTAMTATLDRDGLGAEQLPYLNAALFFNPSNASALNCRAIVYATMQRYESALKDYNRLIELKPDHSIFFTGGLSGVYAGRARLFERMKQPEKAIADLSEAIKLDPDFSNLYSDRAGLYATKGNYKAAESDLATAAKLAPDASYVYSAQSSILEQQGKYDAAVSAATKYIDLTPNEYYGYDRRAQLYRKLGKEHLAAADYQKVCEICQKKAIDYPEEGAYPYAEGQAYKALGKMDLAEINLEQARRLGYKGKSE